MSAFKRAARPRHAERRQRRGTGKFRRVGEVGVQAPWIRKKPPPADDDLYRLPRWLFICAAGLLLLSVSIAFSRLVVADAVDKQSKAYEKLRNELVRSGRL